MSERILVIRLGALGDLVMCAQAFAEIRQAHPAATIALLTTAPYENFARLMPWFDQIIIDPRPRRRDIGGWLAFKKTIKAFAPTRIYDLQGKNRQTLLYALLGGPWGPDWSGAAPFCRYPRLWPPTPGMHFMEFIAAQLRKAEVLPRPAIDWSWLQAPVADFQLPQDYMLFIPGCTPSLPQKRWPPERYAELANHFFVMRRIIVLIGTAQDAEAIAAIKRLAPHALDLSDRTSLPQLATLARGAIAVIGNDTGPMHLAAAVGAPTLALFSAHTDPAWSKPPGPRSAFIKRDELAQLGKDEVLLALHDLLAHKAA